MDPYAKVRPLPDGSGIDTTGLKFEINPFDEIAVEEAVRQKEKNPAIEITVVSIGGAECEEQLRKALAIGADDVDGLVVTEKAVGDEWQQHPVGLVLAVEERADVPDRAELRGAKLDRRGLAHASRLSFVRIAARGAAPSQAFNRARGPG